MSVIKKLKSLVPFLLSLVGRVKLSFDIRIVFFFGGLFATGYGLYLWFSAGPALVFVGLVLMVLGWLMEEKHG